MRAEAPASPFASMNQWSRRKESSALSPITNFFFFLFFLPLTFPTSHYQQRDVTRLILLRFISIVIVPGTSADNSATKRGRACSWLKPLVASTDNDTPVFYFSYELNTKALFLWKQLVEHGVSYRREAIVPQYSRLLRTLPRRLKVARFHRIR